MIIISGHELVPAKNRDKYVDAFRDLVSRARAFDGCVHIAITADSVDPERVSTIPLRPRVVERVDGHDGFDIVRSRFVTDRLPMSFRPASCPSLRARPQSRSSTRRVRVAARMACAAAPRHPSTTLPRRFTMYPRVRSLCKSGGGVATAEG